MILSYFGWKSHPLIRLGSDSEGKRIIEDMKKWGVKTKFVEQESEIHTPKIIERVFTGKNQNIDSMSNVIMETGSKEEGRIY